MQHRRRLNFADLTSLLILFAGTLGSVAGARSTHAGTIATVLFGVGGFSVSYGWAWVSNRLMWSVSKSRRPAVNFPLYLLMPIPLLLAVAYGTFFLAAWLSSLMR